MDSEFRIYTEWKPGLPSLVATVFPNATILLGIGTYLGQHEDSAIVVIVADAEDHLKVYELAVRIKSANGQSAVLMTEAPVFVTLA